MVGVTPIRGVLGVIVEWGHAEGVETLIVIANGTIVWSIGTGGGGSGFLPHQYARTRETALNLCERAADAIAATTPGGEFPKPASGRVRFYLLTIDGVRAAETDSVIAPRHAGGGIGVHDGKLASMMAAGHAVVAALGYETDSGVAR